MNISEKHKAFVWMLPKTGSMHCFHVLTIYGFETIRPKINDRTFVHNHSREVPKNSDYKFICTARNPFTRYLSLYKFNNKDPKSWSPNEFRKFFYNNQKFISSFLWPFSERIPDYFVRTEFLWKDYNEIPFIKNSKFNTSGALYEFCQNKFNYTPKLTDPQKYYTPDMVDYFFSVGKKYFDLLNYSYPF